MREAPDQYANAKTRAAQMLRGAQRYLEAGHVKHVSIAIQSNRAQVEITRRLGVGSFRSQSILDWYGFDKVGPQPQGSL